MHVQSDDEVFVTRCLDGDQAAFAFLVDKYKGAVHAYAYHRILDYQEAQDIAQEVFIKAYKKLAQLKWPHRFRSWLYTIASNECSTWLREHLKECEQEVPLEDVPVEDLNELAVRNHSDEDIELTVKSAMEALPDDSQLALSLYYMSDLSTKEVAGFMGISPNNVGVKLHRARKQLGERLEKMLGKRLGKEKLSSGFTFNIMNSIKGMPIPSLSKPPFTKWAPIPVSIGLALLIGVIGYGVSSGKDIPQDMPILRPVETTFEVSLLPDLDSDPEQAEAVTMADERLSLLLGGEVVIGEEDKKFGIRQLWAGPDVDGYGAPSPNSRYLSYVDWDSGDLAIYELDTGKKRRLTNKGSWDESGDFAEYSIWSPDGKQIVYDWYNDRDENSFMELRVIRPDGTEPRILYSNEEVGWAQTYDWSPDGEQILSCFSKKDRSHQIVLVSVADGSVRVLKALDSDYPENMCFSPDGRYIVYDHPQKEGSPEHDISLLSIDGDGEIPLVGYPSHDRVLGWAPDGRNILFASDRTGTLDAWVIQVADGKPRGTPKMVKPDIGRGFTPLGFTRDGSFYYDSGGGKINDVYVAKLDPETGKVLAPPREAINRFVESNSLPDYSPDGKYLTYISTRLPIRYKSFRPVGNVLCIRSLETGEEREFRPEMKNFGFPKWSPDSRQIMVVNWEDDEKHMGHYLIDAQTGEVKLAVMSKATRIYAHEWGADGKSVFLVRSVRTGDRDKDFYQIVVRDIESGSETELYRGSDNFTISRSPDGKWLAFLSQARKKTLRVMPANGGEPREIHTFDKEESRWIWHTWTADGKYILMPKRTDGEWNLWRIPVESGEPQNFGFEMAAVWQLSAHPDGQHIAFSTTSERPGEVWVMENFLPTYTAAK